MASRVAERAFQVHAATYVAVNAFLFMVWLITGAGHPWFLYPLGGWGIALAIQAVATFNGHPDDDDELEPGDQPRSLG